MFDGHERGTYDGGFTDDFLGNRHAGRRPCQAQRPSFGYQREDDREHDMESCVATINSTIHHYDVHHPNYYSGGLEVVARFARDAQAFLRAPLPSRDPDNVSGTLNPPESFAESFARSKKESRHRHRTELGPSSRRGSQTPRRWP